MPGRTHTPTHWQAVADTYREAGELGLPPTRHVADVFAVPKSRAAQWVTRARDRGLLPPAGDQMTKPWKLPRKLRDVAAALGVDSHDLFVAIRDHADGDIRLGTTSRDPLEP